MTVSLNQLQEYIGTEESGDFITGCLNSGKSLVERYIGTVDTVPTHVEDQAVLIVSSELFHRRSAPNGIAQFASMDGSPIRVGKDPMTAVYPLLLPYVGYAV